MKSVVVALAASMLAFTAPAAAHAQVASSANVATAASGSDQCALPVAEREGGWFCLGSSGPAPMTVCSVGNGYEGCWTRASAYKDEFSGTGEYGYGSTPIGTVTVTFSDTITGYSFSSVPITVRSTHAMSAVTVGTVRVSLTSSSPGATGSNIAGTGKSVSLGDASAGTTKSTNLPPNYDNIASWITVSHKPEWGTPGYPGRWYYGTKSLMMYKSGKYLFYADERLPGTAIYAGWHS
jgi:hypothetical protein